MKTQVKIISITAVVILLLIFIAFLSGAFVDKVQPEKISQEQSKATGLQYVVKSITEETTEVATGTISARDETAVSSRILATIRSINVRAGNSVKQGDELLQLDDRELKAKYEQTRQLVVTAKASLDEIKSEYERIDNLYERQVVSRSEFDRVTALLKSSLANYQRSQEQLKEAETALSFAVIKSPIDGKVIERYAEPGDTASPGVPLIKIYNPSLLRLDAQVRESLTSKTNVGENIKVHIDAINKELTGIVDEVVPSADPGSRSVTVKVLLPSSEGLYPGMFGRLLIPTGEIERRYIPKKSISHLGQLEFVEILKDNKVSRRYIRSGRENEKEEVEVLSGLDDGETILIK
jgi:membrane fusion protein (multidrug efflux system)